MLLVPTLLASLLLNPQGQPRLPGASLAGKQLDFFRQVVATPTGANGYEEYVEAAAILNESNFGDYQSLEGMTISDVPRAFTEDKDGKKYPIPIPEGLSIQSTTLEVRQACIRRFGYLMEIIRRGNGKPVFQPRTEIGVDTLLPELAHFKNLAKLLLMKSQVEFASGSSAAATDALCEALRFARNIGEGSIIHMLVGIACNSFALSGFESGLGRLSLQDASNAIKISKEILNRPAPASAALQVEFDHILDLVSAAVERPESVVYSAGVEPDPLWNAIRGLDEARKTSLKQRIRENLQAKQAELKKTLAMSEREWHKFQDIPLSGTEEGRNRVESIACQVVDRLTPSYGQVLASQAKARAQLRILRASARVIAYKWTKGKLPSKLEDAMPAAEIEDPASGGKLTYERPVPGSFVIQSKGFGDLGPIGLVYRRSGPGQQPPDNSIPPPAK